MPTQWGTTRRVLLRVVSVTDDKGEPATTKITREGAYLKIRIGDPDVWLPSGTTKTYVITYEALGMINWFDEVSDWEPYAELYWNVTGNEWDTVIEKSSFRVRFPLVEEGHGLRLRVYAGPYGSTAQGTLVEPSTAFFDSIGVRMTLTADKASAQRDRPLYPGEGLTLVLNLPAQTVRTETLVIGGFAVVGLAVLSAFASPIGTLTPPIVGGVLSLAVVGFFARGMPMRTPKGARAHRDILGFEEFIRRARGRELDWMTKKHPDAALFEKYLPHAVAFGLLHEWCEAFKDVLQEPPSWYHDPYQGFRYRQFSRDMERVNSKVDRAVGTPPRSAGASGGHSGFDGGFSGGGFGGGGRGSW